MKKLLAIGVILLFIGLALAPSINAYINKISVNPIPDLNCKGELYWRNLTSNAIETGYFVVENIGEEYSELDWEIESYPEWGNWTFTPGSGDNLTPFDGQVTVECEVVAPDEITGDLGGMIKVINKENPDDICEIPVSWFEKSINSERIEIESLDNGEKEKISIIGGSCMGLQIGIGLFRDVDIWVGCDTSVDIFAYTSFPLPLHYEVEIRDCHLKAPIFIGYCFVVYTGRYRVGGIAIGDIEW